jgi:hypothetical protein
MSTWGYLRFQLLQSNPGKSLDLLDSWLNTRYQSVLDSTDWTGVHANATLQTQAAYLSTTDTVTFTVGSAAVVGSGTTWAATIVGDMVYRTGDQAVYKVTTWTDATHFTLDRPYEGTGIDAPGVVYAAAAYTFMQYIYALPADCKAVERILDPFTDYPLAQFTPAEMDASAGPLTMVGEPQSWAEIADSAEVIGTPSVHQVQLYPPPLLERGYPLEYLRNAFQFNGTNLAQSPLAFVSDAVILYGAKADIAMDNGKLAIAAGFEVQFKTELNRLLLLEHSKRRKNPTVKMDPRFTRHRMMRVVRGSNRHGGF